MSNKSKTRSSQNQVPSRRGSPYGSGVTTRKFFGKSKIDSPESSKKSKTNSDFIISTASRTKILSNITISAAEHARDSLKRFDDLINESIKNDSGDNKKGSKGTLYSENDLHATQNITSDEIAKLANFNSIQNSSVKKLHESAVRNILRNGTIGSSLSKNPSSTKVNKATPIIDFATVENSSKGANDKFSVNITFTLERKYLDNVKAIRIFRSKLTIPESTRHTRPRLSRLGMDMIAQQTSRTYTKNEAIFGNSQQRNLDHRGIKNALSDMTKVDEFTGKRNTIIAERKLSVEQQADISSTDKDLLLLQSYLKNSDNLNLDSSVVSNLKAMRNIQLQNPELALTKDSIIRSGISSIERDTLGRLQSQQIKDARSRTSKDFLIQAEKNSIGYKEIALIPINRIRNKNIGGLTEFYYDDVTVELGETYTYYMITIDNSAIESIRSRIIKVSIENIIPPPKPLRLIAKQDGHRVSLSILPEINKNIEKFEIYRREENSSKITTEPVQLIVINGPNGFIVEKVFRNPVGNGFIQIGETQTINNSGATFIDKTVIEGKSYEYRVYSIDIFGNKSQHPKTSIVFVNERSSRSINLKRPSLLSEIDSYSKTIKVTITSDDDRIKGFYIARKNHTLKERAFTIPIQETWNGFISKQDNQIIFVDDTVRIDNIYQYQIYGIDRFGNKTSYETTNHLFMSRRSSIDKPINIRASQIENGIRLTWEDSNLDIDPQDKIGNIDDLAATSKRTLFQVERKKISEERWEQFEMFTETFLEDKFGQQGDISPSYRPDYLEINNEYLYRVATFQTGGFISNFSTPIKVNTFRPVLSPTNFRVKIYDSKREPFFIALNWDTSKDSGYVNKWIIERAIVNNFAAATLNMTNIKSISKLKFIHVQDVMREASRSRSRVEDNILEIDNEKTSRQNKVLSSAHHFIDESIEFGNTYFYRITAVGLNNNSVSQSIIRGIKLTDPSFDRKLNSILSQRERNLLSRSSEPLLLKTNLRSNGNGKSNQGY